MNPAPTDGSNVPPIDWEAALHQHQRWLRTVIGARLGESGAVDEVFQEVSLAVLQQRSRPTDLEKVAPWLYRLAVLQTLQYRRRMGRQRKLIDRYVARLPSTAAAELASDPLDWLLADERRQLVRRALGQLGRRDAEILLLKYTEDWSYHQLAQRLGISHSAIEARLHRARQKLRAALVKLELGVET